MLNESTVRAAKPRDKAYKLSDEKALYLLVSPTGAKCWRVKYYIGGKERVLALGQYPDVPLKDQDNWVMRWQKLRGPIRHCSGKTLVCGHTKQHDGVPLVYDQTVCIDTGAYDRDGWLTCLDVDSGKLWQANELGQRRNAKAGAVSAVTKKARKVEG